MHTFPPSVKDQCRAALRRMAESGALPLPESVCSSPATKTEPAPAMVAPVGAGQVEGFDFERAEKVCKEASFLLRTLHSQGVELGVSDSDRQQRLFVCVANYLDGVALALFMGSLVDKS